MNVKIKKMIRVILFVSIITVGFITSASAKFWGWQNISSTDWADGNCAYRQTCRIHYILWIAGEEQCTTTTITCLDN